MEDSRSEYCVICPYCQGELRFDDVSILGRKVSCGHCGGKSQVPESLDPVQVSTLGLGRALVRV